MQVHKVSGGAILKPIAFASTPCVGHIETRKPTFTELN